MNILFANNFHYNRGGSERVFFDEINLLQKHNFNIDVFSFNDPESIVKFGINNNFLDVPTNKIYNTYSRVQNLFWNFKAENKIENIIKNKNYNLLHMHNIHSRLSHSITDVAYKNNLKMVLTLHDQKYVCPNYLMMYNNKICEDCKGGKFYNAILNKCHKDSYFASGLIALELYNFNRLNIYDKINTFIAPSKFLLNKYTEMGFKGKIKYVPNFIDINFDYQEKSKHKTKDYYLFIGRLSKEKGIINLINAFKKNNKKLIIIGDGPIKDEVKSLIKKYDIQNRVTMTGYLESNKVFEYIFHSKAVIIPSICYENSPISILETLYYGKPILASNLGGIPELVVDSKNGFLFDYEDFNSINKAIEKLEAKSTIDLNRFKEYSQELINSVFSKQNHFKLLKEVYEEI